MPLRPMGREQMWMLPPTLDELLPLDHPARFVAEFVDALDREDWAELGVKIDGEVLGAPAYHPRALLSVWLYGFMTGVRSCRKLEAACRDQIPYLWLTGWQHPDHNTLWRFYRGHRQAMRKLFERTVRTAVTMKLVDLAVQAVDGTKVVANASLNRSYDAEGLRGLLERLESAIADLEAQNEAGEDTAVAHLPEELADKEVLREQVRQAMDDLTSQKRHKRINLTDPDARLNSPTTSRATALRVRREIGRSLAIGPHDEVLRRHRSWMSTSVAQEAYRLRKQLVEPVFGIIKEQQGARRFLLRGLVNVAAEWTMLATAFNLRTLCRVWRSSPFIGLFNGPEPRPVS